MESRISRTFRCILHFHLIVICTQMVLFSSASTDGGENPHTTSSSPSRGSGGDVGGRANCTAGSMNGLPCTPDRCFLRGIPVPGADIEPCLPSHHQDYITDEFYKYMVPPPIQRPLPVGVWIMFRNRLEQCQDLLAYNSSSELCPMSDYCEGQYPWYLSAPLSKKNKFGVNSQAQLCMTDTTSRGTAVCCHHSVNVTVRSCGFYNVYKVDHPLIASSKAGMCTARLADISSGIEKRSTGLVKHSEYLPMRLDELTEERKQNLISVQFSALRTSEINIWAVIEKYNSDLILLLNSFYNSRARRWTYGSLSTLSLSNIRRVIGTPIIQSSNLYYTYYVESDSGEVLSETLVKRVSKYLSNTEFTPLYAYINSTVTGPHPEIHYPEVITPTSDIPNTQPASEASSNSTDWKYILYIICFTAGVLVIVLLVLALYTWKLHHSLQGSHQRSTSPSKLDRILLCNKRPLESSDHVVYQNGHSNSHIRISNSLSRTPAMQSSSNISKANGHANGETEHLTKLNSHC